MANCLLVVGLPGIIIGLLFILTVKDPARKGQQLNQSGQVDQVKFTQCLQFIKKHAKTFCLSLFRFYLYAMALYSLTSWTPAFYIRKFQLAPTETGYMLGTILLVANTLGVFCAGWLNDWFIKKDAKMHQCSRGDWYCWPDYSNCIFHPNRSTLAFSNFAHSCNVLCLLPTCDFGNSIANVSTQPI